MPKLSPELVTDVKRYIHLRYSHWNEDERQSRIKKTIKALKKEAPEVQEGYSAKVAHFFDLNADVLVESMDNAKRQIANDEVTALLNVDKDKMLGLALKHGGNINAVMDELRGNNNQ